MFCDFLRPGACTCPFPLMKLDLVTQESIHLPQLLQDAPSDLPSGWIGLRPVCGGVLPGFCLSITREEKPQPPAPTLMHTCTCTEAHARTHTNVYVYIYIYICKYICTPPLARMHTLAHSLSH